MRIIKRKKGKKEYFYLQHSFRKGPQVITKEVYLGKEIPKNIGGFKQKLEYESKKDLHNKLEKIKKNFQKEWKSYPESIKEQEQEQIAISFTYNTNAIEGSKITLQETRDIIEEKMAPNKPLKDIKETEAHCRVFLASLKKKEKITKELLLKWHKEIFGGTKQDIAGMFRTYLVRVGNYVAPDWQDVKKLMQQLIECINNNKNINPVELAGITHYKFEAIHPFGDGNGRIGRLLMNYILWHNSYPMLIIDYKKRGSYYKALEKGEEYFLHYFLRRYLTTHKKRFS